MCASWAWTREVEVISNFTSAEQVAALIDRACTRYTGGCAGCDVDGPFRATQGVRVADGGGREASGRLFVARRRRRGGLENVKKSSGGSWRDGAGCVFSAGRGIRDLLWRLPISSSCRQTTNRLAMSFWKPGRRASPSFPAAPKDLRGLCGMATMGFWSRSEIPMVSAHAIERLINDPNAGRKGCFRRARDADEAVLRRRGYQRLS